MRRKRDNVWLHGKQREREREIANGWVRGNDFKCVCVCVRERERERERGRGSRREILIRCADLCYIG